MRKYLIILTLFVLNAYLPSQAQITFQKNLIYSYFSPLIGIDQTSDKGYVLCNYLFNGGNGHYFITKLDSAFQLQWCKEIGNSHSYTPQSFQTCLDGSIIICGIMTDSTGYSNMFLTKTDSLGDILWTKIFGGSEHDHGYFVKQINDGGFIVSGKTNTNPNDEAYIIKTDMNGNLLWSTTVRYTQIISGNYARFIDQTSDNGFIACGSVTGLGPGNSEALLMKLDSAGNVQWAKTYGLAKWDQFVAAYQTADHGFLVAGTTDTSLNNSTRKTLLLKTDSSGNILWSKTFSNVNNNYVYKMIKTLDSNYIMVGFITTIGQDINLLKTDSIGTIIWSKAYGNSNSEEGRSVLSVEDGGYLVGGSYNLNNYLIKTDAYGTSNCNETSPNILAENISYPLLTSTFFQGTKDTNYSEIVNSTLYSPVINTLCYSVSINEHTNNLFHLYPNPASDFIAIKHNISFSQKKLIVSLFNVYGQRLMESQIKASEGDLEISLKDFPQGIYFVNLFDGEKIYCQKFILIRN